MEVTKQAGLPADAGDLRFGVCEARDLAPRLQPVDQGHSISVVLRTQFAVQPEIPTQQGVGRDVERQVMKSGAICLAQGEFPSCGGIMINVHRLRPSFCR